MNRWKNLAFFDKNGNNYNFDYDSSADKWIGSIYLPEVSIGLFEVGQIFILEEFINVNTGSKKWGFPHTISEGDTDGCGWNVDWNESDPLEILLFQFNVDFQTGTQSALLREEDGPPLEKYDEIFYQLDYDPFQVFNTEGFLETSVIASEALQINVAINSSTENTYKRTLLITDTCTNKTVAEITVYGETVEEDERLRIMTQNFGYQVLSDDSTVFRNTDINEILPDFIEVNRKRKEMMLEGHNIYPYIGSYKGLINAIKFFGYNNLQIKEFWKNVDKTSPQFGKYVHSNPISIFDPTVKLNDSSFTLPNKKFRKTSLFSLIYKINQIKEDSFTDEDLPITEETSDFTLEEVIIKLFGLKRKLEKDFLPLNARIKDIVGEADFFGLQEVTNTISRNEKNNITAGIDADFKVTPSDCTYIEDLRSLINLLPPCAVIDSSLVGESFICPIPGYPDQNMVLGPYGTGDQIPLPPIGPDPYGVLGEPISGSNFTISDLADFYLAYFSKYAPNINTLDHIEGRSSIRLPDKPDIPIGAPIVLENDSFGRLTWEDVESTWNQLDNGGVYYKIDFEPVDPQQGDIFTLRDPLTGTGASYTVLIGDTAVDVRNAIYTQLFALRTSFVSPWLFYDISQETTPSGPTIRIFGDTPNRLEVSVEKNFPWSNATFRNEQLPGPILYTWDSIIRGNFTEIEWTVYKDATEISPAYFFTVRGSLVDYETLPLVLPYVGDYTVEMKLFDLYNNISSKVKTDFICVDAKEVEYSGWYQARKLKYTWESDGSYQWNDYGSYWNLPISPEVTWDEETPSLYESLDTVNSILNNFGVNSSSDFQIMNFQNNGGVSFAGPYYWDNMSKGNWNDTYHLWWDSTCVSGDTPAFFEFKEIVPNSYLRIIDKDGNVGEFFFDPSITTLSQAKSALNNSTLPIISKYIYNLVLNTANQELYIQAVARYNGSYGDFIDVDIVDVNGDRVCAGQTTGVTGSPAIAFTGCDSIIYRSGQSVSCNPTWNTAKFINDGKTLPRYTWLMFVYDKCKIAGKKNPRWRIKNTSITGSPDIYFESKYLTYLFKDLGRYEIELELEDSNGNIYSKTRNILIIK